MLDAAAIALVLLLFLAVAVERAVEVLLAPLEGRQGPRLRRLTALALSLCLALALVFGLQLDLVAPLLGEEAGLSASQGRTLTAIAVAGGSAPAHELIRLIEEAKTRAKQRDR